MSKYTAGDRVLLRPDLEVNREYGIAFYVEDMQEYAGKTLTIERVHDGVGYRLQGAPRWLFTDEMLLPASGNLASRTPGAAGRQHAFAVGDLITGTEEADDTYFFTSSKSVCLVLNTTDDVFIKVKILKQTQHPEEVGSEFHVDPSYFRFISLDEATRFGVDTIYQPPEEKTIPVGELAHILRNFEGAVYCDDIYCQDCPFNAGFGAQTLCNFLGDGLLLKD